MKDLIRDGLVQLWRDGLWTWPLLYLLFAMVLVRPISDLSMGAAWRGAVGAEMLLLWCTVAAACIWMATRTVTLPVWTGSASLLWLRVLPRTWVVAAILTQALASLGLVTVLFLGTTVVHALLGLDAASPAMLAWWFALGCESLVICGIATVFGTLTRPALATALAAGVVVIGHWMDAFRALVLADGGIAGAGWVAILLVPDLSRFDLAGPALNGVPPSIVASVLLAAYAGAWVTALGGAAALALQARDLA